jgi:hypothetical protein
MPGRSGELSTAVPMDGKPMMKMYEFSVIASGLDPHAEDFESRFYEAGCDDATISFQKGHVIVDFAREAETVDVALASAVKAVRAAGARVDRVEPDPLVSLADIASRTNMTRAAMTQYSKGQRGKGFPAPVARITTDSPLWDWASVALWLFRNKKIEREEAIAAEAVREANNAVEAGETDLGPRLRRRVHELEAAL